MWWDRLCKKKIPQLYQREQAERRRDRCVMENHLYGCMYDVLQRRGHSDQTLPTLNRLYERASGARLNPRKDQ